MSAIERVREYVVAFGDRPDHSLDRVYLSTGEVVDLSLADLREVLEKASIYEDL